MRIVLGCLVLFVGPIVAIVGFKKYQEYEAAKLLTRPGSSWNNRGEVLFFNASWCGPCRQMKPIVTSLKREGFHLRDVDVDKNRNLAEKFGIHAVPTFVFVENGSEVHRFSGGTSADHLRKLCSGPAYH
jgi:thioredoxin 1